MTVPKPVASGGGEPYARGISTAARSPSPFGLSVRLRPGWSWPALGLLVLESAWYCAAFVLIVPGRWARLRTVWETEYWIMAALAVLCAAAALARWWRPRWTAPVALGVLGLGLVVLLVRSVGPLGPLRLMLSGAVVPVMVTAATRRGGRVVAGVAVVLACGLTVLDVGRLWTERVGNTAGVDVAKLLAGGPPTLALVSVTASVLALTPVALGLLLRSTDAAQRAERLSRLRAEERLQVARELHDTVANHVTGILVTAQAAGVATDASTRARCVDVIEETGHQALAAMARIVSALRAPAHQDSDDPVAWVPDELPAWVQGPEDAVRAAIGDDERVRLTTAGDLAAPGRTTAPDVLVTLHRITREALTNARRYTPASSAIDVELRAPGPGRLLLDIDNELPHGAAVVRGGSHGLVGLRERAAAVGGRLEAGPDGGRRWRVHAELPRGSRRPGGDGTTTRPDGLPWAE